MFRLPFSTNRSRQTKKSLLIRKSIENSKILNYNDNPWSEEYFTEVSRNKNILIDTHNVYFSRIHFPLHYLYVHLHQRFIEREGLESVNLHFVMKKPRLLEVMMYDLEQIRNSLDSNGHSISSYGNKNKVTRRFHNLNDKLDSFNIYIYLIDRENDLLYDIDEKGNKVKNSFYKNIDDLYILYLHAYLNEINPDIVLASRDYKMINDHISSKAYLKYSPFNVDLYRLNLVNLKLIKICREEVNLPEDSYLYDYYMDPEFDFGTRVLTTHISRTMYQYLEKFDDHSIQE